MAVEAGDVVLVRSDPRDAPRIIALSKATYRKMVQNLWWAAGYNVVAIPLTAGVLAPWRIVLGSAVGAILMSLSTVIVALDAQLLLEVSRAPAADARALACLGERLDVDRLRQRRRIARIERLARSAD